MIQLTEYKEITSEALNKYEQVSNFEITGASYGDDKSFYQSIIISFDRLETDSEFEARKYKSEHVKEDEINSLKKLIDNNKEEAVKYIKELNLIYMDFIDFNLAKKLREKGFKEDCLCYYNHVNDDLIYNIESPIANNQLLFCHNKHNNVWHKDNDNCDVPTISQVLEWLRKEKKIHISIDVSYIACKHGESLYKYRFYITNLSNHERDATLEDFDSFEEVALAGIEYVLDNLIN